MGNGRMRHGLMVRAVACVVVVGGLAGCGTKTDHTDSNQSPLQMVRASYGQTLHARTAHFSMVMNTAGMTMHGTGATQFQPRALTMTMQAAQLGGQMQMRMVAKRLYMKLPASAGAPLPAGKSWLMLDLSKASSGPLGQAMSQMTGQSPDQSLGYLKGLKSVSPEGKATVRGQRATHYRAVIDLKKLSAGSQLMKSAAKRLQATTGKSTFVTDVFLDGQGRVVRQQFAIPMSNPATGAKATMKMQMDMFGFGQPVHVAAPPQQQTVDMAKLMGGAQS